MSKPTEAQIVAAARVLNKRAAEACNVDEADSWALYGNDYREDAEFALAAALAAQPQQPTAPQADAPSDERAAFESWYCQDYHPAGLTVENGCYIQRGAGMAWQAWQARAAFAPQADALDAARVPLTDAQAERLYKSLKPSEQQDARSLAAFKRLLRIIEGVHRIGAAALAPQEQSNG